jgi:phosphate uptake regulator
MFRILFELLSQDSLMVQATRRADEALERARALSDQAFAALLDGVEPEQDLFDLDQQINEDEVEVRRMVLEHLSANPRADLSAGVVLISTIIDIERIGDYAKNVYQQVGTLGNTWGEGDGFDAVREGVVELRAIFRDTALSVHAGDQELARQAMDRGHTLNKECEMVLESICASDRLSAREAVVLALTTRFVKRIGAHLSNLASSVVNPFDRIGFRPGEGPPKDLTD